MKMKSKLPGTGMNPKMERKSSMAAAMGSLPKSSGSKGSVSRDVIKNKNQTGPSIMKKSK